MSLIHSDAQTQVYPSKIRVIRDIPLTIYNTSLDDEHWVSIEPWLTASPDSASGNVRPREVTTFEFTPQDTGKYVIQHTVHGFTATLLVEDPLFLGVERGSALPVEYALYQNFPNPFNPATTLRYHLPVRSEVVLTVHDILGRRVKALVQAMEEPGHKSVRWDGTNDLGERVSSGVYLFRIRAGDPLGASGQPFTHTRKMVLLR